MTNQKHCNLLTIASFLDLDMISLWTVFELFQIISTGNTEPMEILIEFII